LDKIGKEIEATGPHVEKLLLPYGVKSLDDLGREQASHAIGMLSMKKTRRARFRPKQRSVVSPPAVLTPKCSVWSQVFAAGYWMCYTHECLDTSEIDDPGVIVLPEASIPGFAADHARRGRGL
jgi:hypothetical protein